MAQHDYNIANQSGAAFRSDLNNGLAAIVSQNSGAAQPSTTYAYQWWADTTTGLLKIRNAANNAWITVGSLADANLGLLSLGGGTLTGAVLADDAANAALPAVAFDGDPDTGIFRKGANQLGLSAGGTERAFVDSNGVTIQAQGDLRLADSDNSNWVALQAPATVASNLTLTAPAADGTADQALVTDGAGALSFADRSRLVQRTAVNPTSGPSVDFTSIPSWVKRISVSLVNISTNGTSAEIIRVGTSSGFVTSGYEATTSFIVTGTTSGASSSPNGFNLMGQNASTASNQLSGRVVIDLVGVFSGLTYWACSGVISRIDSLSGTPTYFQKFIAGQIGLSGTLDRIQLTTLVGTAAFDGGLVNIIYEG
jgi:hypothetical protein